MRGPTLAVDPLRGPPQPHACADPRVKRPGQGLARSSQPKPARGSGERRLGFWCLVSIDNWSHPLVRRNAASCPPHQTKSPFTPSGIEPRRIGRNRGAWHERDHRTAAGGRRGHTPSPGRAPPCRARKHGRGVPRAGDGERTVPHSWRGEHRAEDRGRAGADGRGQDDARGICGERVSGEGALYRWARTLNVRIMLTAEATRLQAYLHARDGGAAGHGAGGADLAEASVAGGVRGAAGGGVSDRMSPARLGLGRRARAARAWLGGGRRGGRRGGGGVAWAGGRAAGDTGRDGVAGTVAGGHRRGAGVEARHLRGAGGKCGGACNERAGGSEGSQPGGVSNDPIGGTGGRLTRASAQRPYEAARTVKAGERATTL